MIELICPICGKVHNVSPYHCECGYFGDKLTKNDYQNESERLFAIYKFSKLIFNKKIDWQQSKFFTNDNNTTAWVDEVDENRAVAYIDWQVEGKKTATTAGMLAFNHDVESLIINVDEFDHEMLDESSVRMLFIGDRVKEIYSLIELSLKYLEVSKDNPYFTAENNVLFNKDITKLLYYCNLKPDEEYTIPESVKEVSNWAFGSVWKNNALKVIHCSKKVKFNTPRCTPSPYERIKIIYDRD